MDRRTLRLNFYHVARTLDEDSEPAATDFAVTVAGSAVGVSGVDVSGSVVVLTLTSAVKKGETVTVSYTANASRPIRFHGGGDPAESFTDQAVDNATAQQPMLQDAVVVGTTLTLLYDEALDETSVPATADFAVTVAASARGVSGVAVSGATVALTLASAVTAGQAVTVSYTKGTNPIRDTHADRYEAADLSEEEVDNHAGDTTKPRLLRATVQGTTITLTYDELLDPAHEPPTGHFAVHDSSPSGDGPAVTGVAVRGRTVQVTLASAVTETQVTTLDLTYNHDPQKPDTAIQDFAGNLGRSISTSQNIPPGVKLTHGAPATPPPGGGFPAGGGGSPAGGGGSPVGGGGSPAGGAPVASAGADRDVDPGAPVTLDGTGSTDPDGDALTYSWTRLAGAATALWGADAAQPSFTAPEEPGDLVFHITVTDPGGLSDSDQVTVTVRDLAPSFGTARVAALTLVAGEAMDPVVLPQASGGNGALSYALSSAPEGLAGLSFDAAARTLSGTPGSPGSYLFTWRADDADANRAHGDAAILTFRVTVDDPRAALVKRAVRRTLAAVAQRSVTSALDNIGARFAASTPPTGLTLAGHTVPLGVSGAVREDGAPVTWSRTVEAAELVDTSAFSLALGAAERPVAGAPEPLLWSVWGRGDLGAFAGRPEPGMRYEGALRTAWLGFDVRAVPWVAGLAVSHGTSEADYRFDSGADSGQGRLETSLTALYPYGRWTPLDGLELRGVVGAGRGEAGHRIEDGPRETSVLSMLMASAGARHELPALAGIDLAVRADGSLARLATEDGPDIVDGLIADSWRLRAGLEASRRIALGGDTALELFVEAAARQDGGDGLEGTGLEVAGGLHLTATWLHLEARGRLLAAHSGDGAEERGVSVTARVGPGSHGRGLSLTLSPRFGDGTDGAYALWRDELPTAAEVSGRTAAAVDARIGYGVGLAPHGLLTPFAEAGLAGQDGRRLRVGTRFEASHVNLMLAGEHRESGAAEPEQAIRLDLSLSY